MTGPLNAGGRLPGPEWWERLAARWARWRQRHHRLARGTAVLWAVATWLVLLALVVAYVVVPEVRGGLRTWLWLYLLLAAWFLVARTKSVSWRLVAGFFIVAVGWAVAIAAISTWLAGQASPILGTQADGPGVVIAGLTEESLKLVPLALLVVLAPGRARRFAMVDWLLLGFASGLGFQAFEDAARRISLEVLRPGLLEALDRVLAEIRGTNPYGPGSGVPYYNLSLVTGGSSIEQAGFAGHHVFTALVAVTVGLAVAAWRRGGWGWRMVAVAAPPAAWWLTVADHAGFNAAARTQSRAWVQSGEVPWPLRVAWDWTGHGFGRGWLLLALLLLALLVDARRLRGGEAALSPGGAAPQAPALGDSPGLVADRWARPLTWPRREPANRLGRATARWWAAVVGAACALVAYTLRDVVVTVGVHVRRPGESRRVAMVAGRLALGVLGRERGSAIAAGGPADTVGRRWAARGIALAALGALLVAGLVVAPALAEQVGRLPTGPSEPWLAGLLDSLGNWWDDLGLLGQIAVGLGLAGLIALSGGSLGLAFGVSGAATFVLDKAHGLATFTRNPAAATRGYLATTTPLGALLDLAEFGLTFAPGNFAGAAGGRWARIAVLREVGPSVNLPLRSRGLPVVLVDGTTMGRLSGAELAAFNQWAASLTWKRAGGTGAARAYQVRIYGEFEPVILRPGKPSVLPDGLARPYGSLGDSKHRDKIISWYLPDSLHPSIRHLARGKIDESLLAYKEILDNPSNPAGALEITTNDPRVGRAFIERMRALGIRGYVVFDFKP